jgi:hypothetical protein
VARANAPFAGGWVVSDVATGRLCKNSLGLQIGRTRCRRFWPNQFRVLLTAAADVLMQELRLGAAHTSCARARYCSAVM